MLLESKKEQVKQTPEPTQQELVVIASDLKKQDSPTQSMLVNSSSQDRYAMLMEEALRCNANNLPDQDLSEDP